MKKLLILILFLSGVAFGQTSTKTLAQLKSHFDALYQTTPYRAKMLARSLDNSYDEPVNNQGHYYMGWNLQGLVCAWMATGDPSYYADIKLICENLVSSSVTLPNGFKGWPVNGSNYQSPNGSTLFEKNGFRWLWTFFRAMYKSPSIMNNAAELAWWNTHVDWFELNVWDKWQQTSSGTYRSNAYMTAHSAKMGMEYYIMRKETDPVKAGEFITVYNNICFNGVPSPNNGANLTQKFGSHPTISGGVDFNDNWYNSSYSSGGYSVDWGHFDTIQELILLGFEEGIYWDTALGIVPTAIGSNLMQGLITSWNTGWNDASGAGTGNGHVNGNNSSHYPNATKMVDYGGLYSYGRYNNALQVRMEDYFTGSAHGRPFIMGNLMLNKVIINNGKPVYPEIYTPYHGSGTGTTTTPLTPTVAEWQKVGVDNGTGIPNVTVVYKTITPSDNLQNEINACSSAALAAGNIQILELSPGTYNLNYELEMKSNVFLRGTGATSDDVLLLSSLRSSGNNKVIIRAKPGVNHCGIENLSTKLDVTLPSGCNAPIDEISYPTGLTWSLKYSDDPCGITDLHVTSVRFDIGANNNWMRNVKLLNSGGYALRDFGNHNEFVDCEFNRAYNKSVGWDGTAYVLLGGEYTKFINNKVLNLRHLGICGGSYNAGAKYCVIKNNTLNTNIDFHDGDKGYNLVEGNTITLHSYDSGGGDPYDTGRAVYGHMLPGTTNYIVNNTIISPASTVGVANATNVVYTPLGYDSFGVNTTAEPMPSSGEYYTISSTVTPPVVISEVLKKPLRRMLILNK